MTVDPSNEKDESQGVFDENGFDSEGYDYTGFNEVGLDRHGFDRNGKLFDPTEFGDQEDLEKSAKLEEEFFEAGLLYERDGYNSDGFEGSGGHRYGQIRRQIYDD